MTEKQKFIGFKDGLPTGPEVEELRKKYPAPAIGARIPYADVRAIIGVDVSSARWKSVTEAWRKRELEEGRVIKCEAGEAFYVATPDQITAATYSVLEHVGKTAKKHRRELSTVRAEDAQTRGVVEHQARLMLAVEKDSRAKRMNILPATAAPVQPKIAPPHELMRKAQ